MGHSSVEVGGTVVKANLHHSLDQLDLGKSTSFFVALTKRLVSLRRSETVRDTLGFRGIHMGSHVPKDHAVVPLPVAVSCPVGLTVWAFEEAERIFVKLPHLK